MAEQHTYRRGEKVVLTKDPKRFLVEGHVDEVKAKFVGRFVARNEVVVEADDVDSAMADCRTADDSCVAHHLYYLNDEEFFITDRVIITFCEPHTEDSRNALKDKYKLEEVRVFSSTEVMYQVTNATNMNPAKLVCRLTEDDDSVEVADMDVNHVMHVARPPRPTDPEYLRQWHLHTHSTHSQVDPRSSSHCEEAWRELDSFGSSDVVVAVADDGCDLSHKDFNGEGKFAGWGYFEGERLVTNEDPGDRSKMYTPGENHGTSCAGVIAAEADGEHTVGACPGCRLLPIKWELLPEGYLNISDSILRTALDFIADKADVMNNSWGGGPMAPWGTIVTARLEQLARSGGRRGKGILFLWAAGNNNTILARDHTSQVPVPWTGGWNKSGWIGVARATRFSNTLVGIPGVLHVAALASTAQRSHYSNYGPGIALTAPTNNVHKYWRDNEPPVPPTVTGLGVSTAEGVHTDPLKPHSERDGVTHDFGGTSSACPLVAGIAALVISANPELTALKVADILQKTTDTNLNHTPYERVKPAALHVGTPTRFDPPVLAGRHPSDVSWDVSPVFDGDFRAHATSGRPWSHWFGYGKVNALRAVQAAKPRNFDVTAVLTPTDLTIPDNTHTWTEMATTVEELAIVDDIAVTVSVSHSYIGDLQVALQGPSGAQAMLHDRTGGSANQLSRTFTVANASSLNIFLGQQSKGEWKLLVRDLAATDTGKVNNCKLSLSTSPPGVERTREVGLSIPENDAAGVSDSVIIDAVANNVTSVTVSVDIAHTYVQDLRITLASPSGNKVTLFNRQMLPSNTRGLIRTWKSSTAGSPLAAFVGTSGEGQWTINVSDLANEDRGKLNSWYVKLTSDGGSVPASTVGQGSVTADNVTGTAVSPTE